MTASVEEIATYLERYIAEYRLEYERFVSLPPAGGGYPRLTISPYQSSSELQCFVATDGYVLADLSFEPAHEWTIAGGPALMVDFPVSRTPERVVDTLKSMGLFGKHIGIYRLVSKEGFRPEIWEGLLPDPQSSLSRQVGNTLLKVTHYALAWSELIQRLTFGAFGFLLDIRLPDVNGPFWQPHVVRDLGFLTADREHKRFFRYLEFSPHVHSAAWDPRGIPTRVRVDVQRDFAHAFVGQRHTERGGTISTGGPSLWPEHFHDRLSSLETAIHGLKALLEAQPPPEENALQRFLQNHPILIDVYGEVVPKPRLVYPEGESPIGKTYVEPDFLIRYPGQAYRLVEIERPSKRLGTQAGQPRSEIAQAAFQISEWVTYIANHYDMLKTQFPGISTNCRTMIVVSRSTAESVGAGRDPRQYLELVRNQFSADDILTYDDLLERAAAAYVRLASMSVPVPSAETHGPA